MLDHDFQRFVTMCKLGWTEYNLFAMNEPESLDPIYENLIVYNIFSLFISEKATIFVEDAF